MKTTVFNDIYIRILIIIINNSRLYSFIVIDYSRLIASKINVFVKIMCVCVLCVFIVYIYINTHTCMYMFKKNVVYIY